MPATAGRGRMPHNNRMHSSAALKMTGIWKNTIGYDPYAAENEKRNETSETSYEQAKGLMALAKLSNKSNDVRGACKKCGMVGHLTFQCRNHLEGEQKRKFSSASDSFSSSDSSSDEDQNESSSAGEHKQQSFSRRLSPQRRSRSSSQMRGRQKDRSERRGRDRSNGRCRSQKVPAKSCRLSHELRYRRRSRGDRDVNKKLRRSHSSSFGSERVSAKRRRRTGQRGTPSLTKKHKSLSKTEHENREKHDRQHRHHRHQPEQTKAHSAKRRH